MNQDFKQMSPEEMQAWIVGAWLLLGSILSQNLMDEAAKTVQQTIDALKKNDSE
jgi:hypothetical protein